MPRSRRSTKVCSRCRKRKTKCDFIFPACTPCKLANLPCLGFDPSSKEAVPRSFVKSLEAQVEELEARLLSFNAASNNVPYLITTAVAQATISIGIPFQNSFLDSKASSSLFFRPSCPPLAIARERGQSTPEKHPSLQNNRHNPGAPINLRSVPFSAINRMIQNYVDIHLPQYPCVSENAVNEILDRIQHQDLKDPNALPIHHVPTDAGLGHFEYFVLLIALAISAMTLTWKADYQARVASESFYNAAVKHLQAMTDHSEIQALQISLLLAHYAHMCPERVDNWTCISNAVRIVLNLGLYLECNQLVQGEPYQRSVLFWVAYGMERSLCTNLRLPLSFPEEAITVKFPTVEETNLHTEHSTGRPCKKSVAYHICRYRALETEVHRVLHLEEDLTKFGNNTIEEWIESITQRLKQWYETAQSYTKYDMLEFKHVQFHHLMARIHRPTPRLRLRGPDNWKAVLNASSVLIQDYLSQERRRRLFYPWHGVHILFETAVISLEACWSARNYEPLQVRAHEMLQTSIPQCLQLLTNIGERWGEAAVCADRLRPLVDTVRTAFNNPDTLLLTMIDESVITAEILDLLFTDGPLSWTRANRGEIMSDMSESDPWLNSLVDDSLELFSWNPEWCIMPADTISIEGYTL
ncbi:transcriptional regulator family: Fungal Specific TF [Aspergillus niger]|nr:transcriptional regulator family: Fungal Specific TF [Aspergillus niger]